MSKDNRLLEAALRQDLAAFIERSFHEVVPGSPFQTNWHIEAIAYRLQQVRTGEITRLVITLPPRSLKSLSASAAFPAFALGHDPTMRIVTISYAEELALKQARDCRRIMESRWYRKLFSGTRLSKEKNTEGEFMTTRGGYRYSTSVGGSLTGRGGNLIIIDDPIKAEDAMSDTRRADVNDWYANTLYSRLDNKTTDAIILIMQRLHLDDLVGLVLDEGGWTHLNLPAIAEIDEDIPLNDREVYHRTAKEPLQPSREPVEELERTRRRIGTYNFSAQYQQEPIPPDGGIVRWTWFQTYEVAPRREEGDWIIQSWDPAAVPGEHNAYSVCTTWMVKEIQYFLLDVLRLQVTYPELKHLVKTHSARWRADDVVIEFASAGIPLSQELRMEGLPYNATVSPLRPKFDKKTRMAAQSHKIEAGRVFIPEEASWLEAFRREIKQFPHGSHTDQVDSLSQFLYRLEFWPMPQVEYSPAPVYPRRVRDGWPRAGINLG